MSDARLNCSESVVAVAFSRISLPLIVVISVISILLNVFNILIFSKKKMISPTNSILLGIAVGDLIKVLIFLVTSIVPVDQMSHSYDYQVFYLFCNVAMYLMHAFALWCGVLLALFRFFYLRYYASSRTKVWFSLARARLAVCLAFLANLIAMVPYASSLQIDGFNVTHNATVVMYSPSLDERHEFKIRLFNGLAQKVLPCLIMTCFCFFIIKSLRQTERRRESLVNLNRSSRTSETNRHNSSGSRRGCESFANSEVGTTVAAAEAPQPSPSPQHSLSQLQAPTSTQVSARSSRGSTSRNSRRERRSRDHRRTTSFLLVIIVLYILYEIPMSLLNILEDPMFNLTGVQCFFYSFIRMLNTLGLINNSVNFVLYCFMSKQFREVFKHMFALVCYLPPKANGTGGSARSAAGRQSSGGGGGVGSYRARRKRHGADNGSRSSGRRGGGLIPLTSASMRSAGDDDQSRFRFSVSEGPSNAFYDP